jgi:hypothetical protein
MPVRLFQIGRRTRAFASVIASDETIPHQNTACSRQLRAATPAENAKDGDNVTATEFRNTRTAVP